MQLLHEVIAPRHLGELEGDCARSSSAYPYSPSRFCTFASQTHWLCDSCEAKACLTVGYAPKLEALSLNGNKGDRLTSIIKGFCGTAAQRD